MTQTSAFKGLKANYKQTEQRMRAATAQMWDLLYPFAMLAGSFVGLIACFAKTHGYQ